MGQGKSAELLSGQGLRFGASTRVYTLEMPEQAGKHPRKRLHEAATLASASTEQQPKGRVHFADKADDANGLEQIIGYSDGRTFAVNVGPTANDGALKGQFTDVVKPRTLEAKVQSKTADDVDGIKPSRARREGSHDEKRQRRVQPLLPQRSSGLYDLLPSPSRSAQAS